MSLKQWQSGYCTNIHPGIDLPSILQNFRTHAARVREILQHEDALGVGIWIPHNAATELCENERKPVGGVRLPKAVELAERLREMGLKPYTINGFPYGNFHQPVVKHKVYQPTWAEADRQIYTEQLIAILHSLLPDGEVGSISTLPIGWGELTPEFAIAAAKRLRAVSETLRQLEAETGRRIVVSLEPEPGCMLDTAGDVIEFFDRHLAAQSDRRYLTVCHDICHAAVMNESQQSVLQRYAENGLTIGKVQVSSAIEVPWSEMDDQAGTDALRQLSHFAEDRYLHQTGIVDANGQFQLDEDLPELLARTSTKPSDRAWRIHFHVPIFLQKFGNLRGTSQDVLNCLDSLAAIPADLRIEHMEVETYAWSVLPASMRDSELAQSIASELKWLSQKLANR